MHTHIVLVVDTIVLEAAATPRASVSRLAVCNLKMQSQHEATAMVATWSAAQVGAGSFYLAHGRTRPYYTLSPVMMSVTGDVGISTAEVLLDQCRLREGNHLSTANGRRRGDFARPLAAEPQLQQRDTQQARS